MLYAIVMDNDASLPFFSFSSGKYSDYKYQKTEKKYCQTVISTMMVIIEFPSRSIYLIK